MSFGGRHQRNKTKVWHLSKRVGEVKPQIQTLILGVLKKILGMVSGDLYRFLEPNFRGDGSTKSLDKINNFLKLSFRTFEI